jgi:ABC-type amino acid transport substrate-binding protein
LEVGYFPDRWPYSADRDDGVQTGFEVRLLERMVESWLGSRQSVTFVPVTEENARQMLQNGELDMLVGGWMHTFEDEMQFDFSDVVYDDGVSILSPASAPVGTLDALAGQPVGVIAGSAGEAAVPALSQLAGVGLNPVLYPNRDAAIEALQGGEIAAILAERRYLLDPLYRVGGFVLTDTRFTYRPIAFILPQGDSSFRDLVNLTLATLHANGAFAEIYTTWFDDPVFTPPVWPGQPVIPLRIQ